MAPRRGVGGGTGVSATVAVGSGVGVGVAVGSGVASGVTVALFSAIALGSLLGASILGALTRRRLFLGGSVGFSSAGSGL